MSSFAGVSVLADGELCAGTASTVGTSADCGYHLLVVHDYPRTKQEAPTGESISSRPFMVGGHCWIIKYYPNGEDCADFISLQLCCLQDDANQKKNVEAKVVFTFIDEFELQNPVYIAQLKTCSFNASSCWSSEQDFTRDALEQSSVNLKDDCFTIRCDIMVSCNTKDDAGRELLLPDIRQHFNHLLQTEVGADVEFEVGGEMLAAHRCVLAARSKVFMSQLFGPMKEGTDKTAVIHIKDMKANVFRALLSFIYTDSFPFMEEDKAQEEEAAEDKMLGVVEQGQEKVGVEHEICLQMLQALSDDEAADDKMSGVVEQGQEEEVVENEIWLQWLQDLLVAADRYDVQRLKCICEKHLSEHLCVSMVMSTLALAEQHHCQGLKDACFKFIQVQSPSCLQAVMATDGWDYVVSTYPSSSLPRLLLQTSRSNALHMVCMFIG